MVNSPNLHEVLGDSDCIIADCTCGDGSKIQLLQYTEYVQVS